MSCLLSFRFLTLKFSACSYLHVNLVTLLQKENLKSDDKQFFQYKKQRTITSDLKSLNTKKTTTHGVRKPCPGLGQAQQCGGVKSSNGVPTI